MNVLVTGSNGFVGRALVDRLLDEGHGVGIWLRPDAPAARLESWAARGARSFVETPNPDFWQPSNDSLRFLETFRPDACVHLAWAKRSREHRHDPDHYTHNYAVAVRLARSLTGSACTRFLGLGSQSEYGRHPAPLGLSTPLNPDTAYGLGKLMAGLATERLCRSSGIAHAWLRLTAAYGPGETGHTFVGYATQRAAAGKPIEMSKGEQRWDYLYIDDLVSVVMLAIEKKLEGFFPLGSGEAVSLLEIAQRVALLRPGVELALGRVPYAPDENFHVCADPSAVRERLGWQPRVTIEEGLRRTVEGR